jgi:hypothetical protein
MSWIELAHDTGQRTADMYTVIKLSDPKQCWEQFWAIWPTGSFSKTQHHEIIDFYYW